MVIISRGGARHPIFTSSLVIVHCRCDGHTPPDLSPSDQTVREKRRRGWCQTNETILDAVKKEFLIPPVFLHTTTQRYLLPDLRAHRVGEDDLGQIGLDSADTAPRRQRANVHHQHLILGQLLDLQPHRRAQ